MPLRMPVRHGREYYSYRHQSGWRSLWSLQAHSAKIFDSCRSGYFPTENLCKSRHSISHLFIVYALKHTQSVVSKGNPYGNNSFACRRFKWRLPNWSILILPTKIGAEEGKLTLFLLAFSQWVKVCVLIPLLFRVSLNKKNLTISRKSGRVFKGLKIRVVKTS